MVSDNKPNKATIDFTRGYLCCICALIQMDGMVEVRTTEEFIARVGNTSLEDVEIYRISKYDLLILRERWNNLQKS